MNSLDGGVSRNTSFTKLSANTGLFHSSEWDSEIGIVAAIYPDHCKGMLAL